MYRLPLDCLQTAFNYSSYPAADVGFSLSCVTPAMASGVIYCLSGINIPVYNSADSCPNLFGINFSTRTTLAKEAIIVNRGEIVARKSLIDGSNTKALLATIESEKPGQLKNTLLSHSPYLSDEVLINAIWKQMPPGHTKQVLEANSPLHEEVMYWVHNANLPSGIIEQIEDVQVGVNPMDQVLQEIEYFNAAKLAALSDLVRDYLDSNWIDSAMYYLELDGTTEALCALVPLEISYYLANAEIHLDQLREVAVTMESLFPLSKKPKEINEFCDFHNVLKNVKNRPGGYYELTAVEIEQIEVLSQSNTSIARAAKGIKEFLNQQISYTFPTPLGQYKINGGRPEISATNQQAAELKNYPNPFNERTTIKYQLPGEAMSGSIVIYDLGGKLIHSQSLVANSGEVVVDLHRVETGLYLCTLKVDDNVVKAIRLAFVNE